MEDTWIRLGSIAGFLGVAGGAFGAHALDGRLEAHLVEVFSTGSRYALVHGVALLLVGLWSARRPSRFVRVAGTCLAVGTLLFSGSLWLLALSGQRWLGAITPLGGLCLLAGWLALALSAGRPSAEGEP